MRLLQLTDLHVGLPANSVGLKPTRLGVAGAAAQVKRGGLRAATLLATHDEAVMAALRVFVEVESAALDGVLVSGDVATDGDPRDLAFAAALLMDLVPDRLPCLVLPGNHDRFGPAPMYGPGKTRFETVLLGDRLQRLASPFGFANRVIDGCLISGLDLTLTSLASLGPGFHGRAMGLGQARPEVVDPFARSLERLATERQISHVVVVVHFPLEIGQAIPAGHHVLDGPLVVQALTQIASRTGIPMLVISGHLHREYLVPRKGAPLLSMYTCPSTTKQYRVGSGPAVGRNACAIIELIDGGFSVLRYDYDGRVGVSEFVPDPNGPTVFL